MIFLSVGTQAFQFDRLVREIDNAISYGTITDEVFGQTGYCTYEPKYFSSLPFMNQQEFDSKMSLCDLVITHGGVGTILKALSMKKRVIAVARQPKFGEHIDDHQYDIVDLFATKRHLLKLDNTDNLVERIREADNFSPTPYVRGNEDIQNLLMGFMDFTG